MKIFLNADIEGTAGINMWDETRRSAPADYLEFRALMTAEVVAACEGAREAGAEEVLIKDAHDSARNIILEELPDYTRIIRGWSGHPDAMMFGISPEHHAAIYTGYHSKAGDEGNPLAHTSNGRISRLLLNGKVASELTMNALCAAEYGVPSVFVAGDAGICADAVAEIAGIATVVTLEGFGPATKSLAPARSRTAIREGVKAALSRDVSAIMPEMAPAYELVIEFNNPVDAYRAGWFPGARSHGPRAVAFESTSFFETRRAYQFMKV